LRAHLLQPKLTVSDPNDFYEQEADRVADAVLRLPEPPVGNGAPVPASVQRQAPEEEELLPTKHDDASPAVSAPVEAAIHSLPGRGQRLPASVRSFMEPRFHADFSAVRLHTDAPAHDLARSVNAQAFTVGRDIVFGAGHYAPESERGKHLIAHELTHVVQQGAAGKALRAAERMDWGWGVTSRHDSGPQIQRQATSAPVFVGKTFVVTDENAVLRDANLSALKYQEGETLPAGKRVGDTKTVPKGTEVYVSATTTDAKKKLYAQVFQRGGPLGIFFTPLGWIAVSNFGAAFENVALGTAPAPYTLTPFFGLNQTVWDPNALIRAGGPDYRTTGNKIQQGAYVFVLDRSDDTDPPGKYVRVRDYVYRDGRFQAGEILGWTAASNLREGWADIFGPNAAWEQGQYLSQVSLVNIAGTKGELEQLTTDSHPKYMAMVRDAAGAPDAVHIALNSGFRSYPVQVQLRKLYEQGMGNLAAKPGYSNHQNGKAVDLNTEGSGGTGSGTVYDWLKTKSWKYGFIRTVSSEHWHWEYQPDKVQEGKHTTWGV
jgi:hypothetical protein